MHTYICKHIHVYCIYVHGYVLHVYVYITMHTLCCTNEQHVQGGYCDLEDSGKWKYHFLLYDTVVGMKQGDMYQHLLGNRCLFTPVPFYCPCHPPWLQCREESDQCFLSTLLSYLLSSCLCTMSAMTEEIIEFPYGFHGCWHVFAVGRQDLILNTPVHTYVHQSSHARHQQAAGAQALVARRWQCTIEKKLPGAGPLF